MTAERVFLVKLEKTEEMTVPVAASDHDEAMANAEQVFAGWHAVEATEDDA